MKMFKMRQKRLTLIARTFLLLLSEIIVNAILWTITSITFLHGEGDGHKLLGLALIAWTTGLRHALDADHISAIDNATRRIISVPQILKQKEGNKTFICMRRPVTVGLFFSLGHSTVVFVATVAIAISAGVANKFDGFGNIGGIIGASISGSFLILIGCINTVILYKTIKRLRAAEKRKKEEANNETIENDQENKQINPPAHFNGIMTRIAMPILRSVDRPWKMYPVGILFGLGFDTASSIALLSVALIAQQQQRKESNEKNSESGNASVILFALLFTAGMTFIDSVDSCFMIWAYAPEVLKGKGLRSRLRILQNIENAPELENMDEEAVNVITKYQSKEGEKECLESQEKEEVSAKAPSKEKPEIPNPEEEKIQNQTNKLDKVSFEASASKISLLLTTLSILVAFAIGLVVLMGLIGDQCKQCSNAADRQEETGDGDLAGRWWLAWRRANDNFTYIGAGIVGAFVVSVSLWYSIRWAIRLRQKRKGEEVV